MSSVSSDELHTGTTIGFSGINLTKEQFEIMLSRCLLGSAPAPAVPHQSSRTAFQVQVPPFVRNTSPTDTSARKSLFDVFPYVPPSVLLEITRFELHPFNLHKLDPFKLAHKVFNITSSLVLEPSVGSPKDYPTLPSLLEPLLIYFEILGHYAASSGSASAVLDVLLAGTQYCAHIIAFSKTYQWSAVLAYHQRFFLLRAREMERGNYAGWKEPDITLLSMFLVPFPRSRPRRSSRQSQSLVQ